MKNLDFKKAAREKNRQEAVKRHGRRVLLLLPLVLMVLYLQNYIFYIDRTSVMERQILEIQSYDLENPETLKEEERLEELRRNQELLERYEEEDENLGKDIRDRAELTVPVLYALESAMEGRVKIWWSEKQPLRYEEGVLEFTARAEEPSEASAYMERLEKQKLFENVEYSGFERKRGEEEGEENFYLFTVKCRLSRPEGGEE